jgi:DNA topoisomerase I
VPRLRRSRPDRPGWARRRQGRGFAYVDEHGTALGPDDVARCRALVIPPAWTEVWICPAPNGHIQAVGTDDAGRRQYLYHPAWRDQRDRAKHERVLDVACRLPAARRQVAEHLALAGMPRQRALATAFRLLDLGLFRIGGEQYAEDNGSYGLATIEKRHVHVSGGQVMFDYPAKSGQERLVAVADEAVVDAVTTLRSRRGGGPQLLAYKDGGRWHDVSSADINAYVKEVVGGDVSAKDFRTWHGTVLAAIALGERAGAAASPTKRRQAERAAVAQVAEQLGNTPAVARGSYVDRRVVDKFEVGATIARTLERIGRRRAGEPSATREAIERAVRQLLVD